MYSFVYLSDCSRPLGLEVSSRIDINHHWSSSNDSALTLQKYALENNIDASWP